MPCRAQVLCDALLGSCLLARFANYGILAFSFFHLKNPGGSLVPGVTPSDIILKFNVTKKRCKLSARSFRYVYNEPS